MRTRSYREKHFMARNILHTEETFRKAIQEGNMQYASYLELKLADLYMNYMNKYAGSPDHKFSINKKQKLCS